jgi:hypothetical protein
MDIPKGLLGLGINGHVEALLAQGPKRGEDLLEDRNELLVLLLT